MPGFRTSNRVGFRTRIQPLLGCGPYSVTVMPTPVPWPTPVLPGSQVKTMENVLPRTLVNAALGLELENIKTWEGLA